MSWGTRNVRTARVGIAILILFLYGMALASFVYAVIPEANKDIVVVLVGGLNTALGMVCGYFFNVGTRRGYDGGDG